MRRSNSRMAKLWKSMKTSISLIVTIMVLAFPQHSKNSPKGLLKSLLVETSDMLYKRFFARNSDMILVSTVGLCRASMFALLNEQGIVVEDERI